MAEAKKMIKEYVVIVFMLLGALFGIMIMSFIFGQLGPDKSGLAAGSAPYNASLNIQNNTLAGIQAYSSSSTSQFTVLGIAIVLIILIGVFLLFWKIFVAEKSSRSSGQRYMGGNFG